MVEGPGGRVLLSTRISVPARGDRLNVFVPIIPDGMSNTDGEVRLAYAIAAPRAAIRGRDDSTASTSAKTSSKWRASTLARRHPDVRERLFVADAPSRSAIRR
jgi:hypothetical protein